MKDRTDPRSRVLQSVILLVVLAVAVSGCSSGTGRRLFSGPTSAASSSSAPASVAPSSPPAPACAGACFSHPAAAAALLSAARSDVEKVNTYRFSTLAIDEAAGLAVTTGEFRAAYRQAFRALAARAPGLRAIQAATVSATGLQGFPGVTGNVAYVLVAGRLNVTSTAVPQGRVDPFVLTVTLVRTRGAWLISGVVQGGLGERSSVGNAELTRAGEAGASEAGNALTLSRATFDRDFGRALRGSTGKLRANLANIRSRTRKTLVDGGYDLRATVVAIGVVSVAPQSVRLLVRVDGFRSLDPAMPTQQTVIVTVSRVGTVWLASDLAVVGAR